MIRHQYTYRAVCALQDLSTAKRWFSDLAADNLARPVQSYISTTDDPYLNLSIEHHLLQKTDANSAVLFIYVNRPSIIIGRNQNPWLEVNLALLNPRHSQHGPQTPRLGAVDLVRRRSGGGAVFHDKGNVNWTVISSAAAFTRDKHAEMVVRALRSCGVDRARVNERHDIVLDQGARGAHAANVDADDTHVTAYGSTGKASPPPLKVSGSAYKLTRQRALHHGTCLLASPNLDVIPDYLHSPAKPFIAARGVASVSSPVGNIMLSNVDFIAAVQREFARQYHAHSLLQAIELGDACLDDENVRKGLEELKSYEWTYLQTPQFTLSTKTAPRMDVDVDLTVRNGTITEGSIALREPAQGHQKSMPLALEDSVVGRRIHEIDSWDTVLNEPLNSIGHSGAGVSAWLQKMIPKL